MSHVFTATRISKALAGFVLGCCLIFTSTGVQSATANSATLQWAPNSEPDLAGYKIYQGTTPGVYGPSIDIGNTATYTARNLQAGLRYYFAVTAYDTSGNESRPSIEVSHQTPAPPSAPNPPGKTSPVPATTGVIGDAPSNWTIEDIGDMDGDGKADLVWRETTDGSVAEWLGNGVNAPTTTGVIGGAPSNWIIAGIGDMDGDGRADSVWQDRTDGSVAVWLGNGVNAPTTTGVIGSAPSNWTIAGIGDMDGDGKADLVWRETTEGSVAVWLMN